MTRDGQAIRTMRHQAEPDATAEEHFSRTFRDADAHGRGPSLDPYEELASLFLTDGPEVPPPLPFGANFGTPSRDTASTRDARHESIDDAHALTAPIEIALVGHLPVMGGLWLTQYADQVARQEGPTALLRLDRGQITVELLRAPDHRGGLDSVETLDEAMQMLAEAANHWIICPQGEATVDGPLPADALSLITGGDDAATVAAYRMIKCLAERWHVAGWPVPPIGLVVLGATPERVDELVTKLDQTTKAFLDVDLTVVAQHQRMDAIESAGRRTFMDVEMSLADACRSIRVASAWTRRQRQGKPLPAVLPTPIVTPMPGQATSTTARSAPRSSVPSPKVLPGVKLSPKPIGREVISPAPRLAPPREAGMAVEPAPIGASLAAMIPGLTAINAACPSHREVELAVDAEGVLHLIVVFAAIASLRPVEAWARAHADLLRMACPRFGGDRFLSHVVTTDAPAIVPLHGSGLALHLLVTTQSGSVQVALNRL